MTKLHAGSQLSKRVNTQVSIWHNPGTGHIHLACKAQKNAISTVTDQPGKRCHPTLYRKLAETLRQVGKPGSPAMLL